MPREDSNLRLTVPGAGAGLVTGNHAAVAGVAEVGERIRLVARMAERADAVITPYVAPSLPESSGVALLDVRWPPPGPGRERFRGAAVIADDLGVRVLDLAERG